MAIKVLESKRRQRKEKTPDDFGEKMVQFCQNMELIREFADLVKVAAKDHTSKLIKEEPETFRYLLEALQRVLPDEELKTSSVANENPKAIKKIKKNNSVKISFDTGEEADHFWSKTEKVLYMIRIPQHLYNTSLISLITNVELFLSQILHLHFKSYPEAITNKKEKQFSFDDLKQLSTIEDAKNYLITNEVEDFLRKKLEDWIKFFEERLKLEVSFLKAHESRIYEIFLRRNLLVHNDSIVNSIYLKNLKITSKAKLGERLEITEDYLKEAILYCELAFLLVAAEMRSKTKLDAAKEFGLLNYIANKHLQNGRYLSAEYLSKYLQQEKKFSNFDRMIARVNYWQAIKWQNRFTEIQKEVENHDVSGMQMRFTLAKDILLDKQDSFFRQLPQAIKNGDITLEDIRRDTLFKEIRKLKKCEPFLSTKKSARKKNTRSIEAKFESPPKGS